MSGKKVKKTQWESKDVPFANEENCDKLFVLLNASNSDAERGMPFMNEKLARALSNELADVLVQKNLASIPTRKAALTLLRGSGTAANLTGLFPIRERF